MSFNEWKKCKLGEISEIIMGQSPTGDTCNEIGNGVPLLNGPTEFTGYSPIAVQYTINPKKMSEVGDLLFCVRGSTTGKINWSDKKYAIGRGLAALRHKSDIVLQPFLRGLIEYNLNAILLQATGSTFPNVSSQQLLNLEISIPTLSTQQRISSILSSLDDKIELNRQTNKTLETIAQTLFKEMCLPKGEELPEGWKVVKISDVGKVITGKTPSSSYPEDFGDKMPFVTPTDFKNYDKLVLSAFRYLSNDGINRLKNKVLPKNSVIVTCIGSDMGKVAINRVECVTNQQINSVIAKDSYVDFIFYSLLNKYTLLKNMATGGSTMPMINKSQFESIELIKPTNLVLESFARIIEPLNNLMESNTQEIQTLSTLRDSLLPKLMKGEISI